MAHIDEELRRKHGIRRECTVRLTPLSIFLYDRYLRGDFQRPGSSNGQTNGATFTVHYGRCFLRLIAKYAFEETHNFAMIDLEELYREYIKSPYTALTRQRFRDIIKEYFVWHKRNFVLRRGLLIAKKRAELELRRQAEARAAEKRFRFNTGRCSVMVPADSVKEVEMALLNVDRCRVVVPRLCGDGDGSRPSTSSEVTSAEREILEASLASGSKSTQQISTDDAREATKKLLTELIRRTLAEIEPDPDPDGPVWRGPCTPSPERPDEEDDSDATEDAGVEADDETDVADTSEAEDYTDLRQTGQPDFGGSGSGGDSDSTVAIDNMDSSATSDEAEDGGYAIEHTVVKTPNPSMVVLPMKL